MKPQIASIYYSTSGSFGALASAFIVESLQHMISWLLVMLFVVFADLVSGLVKSYRTNEKIRLSRAIRDTLAKLVTYFAVVVCACFTGIAAGGDGDIEKYACLLVVLIEAISIFGNILKVHGYDLDFNKVVSLIVAKKIDVAREEIEDVITKNK